MGNDNNIDSLIKKVGDLPPLPQVAQKALSLIRNPNSSMGDLAEVLMMDQGLDQYSAQMGKFIHIMALRNQFRLSNKLSFTLGRIPFKVWFLLHQSQLTFTGQYQGMSWIVVTCGNIPSE